MSREGRWDQNGERRMIASVVDLIRERVPPLWTFEADVQPSAQNGKRPDAILTLTSPNDEKIVFVADAKRQISSTSIASVLEQIRRNTPPWVEPALPLVIAPYLPQRTREVLAEREISYADMTGNIWLTASRPGLWVSAVGATRAPDTAGTPLRSLKGPRTGRAMRALVEFRPPFGVRELAARARVPAPTLSRVIELLDREALIDRGERHAVAAVDWQGALRRWSLDYTLRTSNRVVPCLDPRGTAACTDRVASADFTYAVTGAFAAERLIPFAPARTAAIYVPDAELARERLRLRQTDSGANVFLVEPFDPVVFERTMIRDELVCANAVQVVADLLTGSGREPSTAEELMVWMAEHEDAWRS